MSNSRKRFVFIILLAAIGFATNTYAQIYPEDDVCRNGDWVQYYLNAQYEGEVEWTVTGGTGSSTTGSIAVKWGVNSPTLELKAKYSNPVEGTKIVYLHPEYKEVGELYRVWIRDQQTSYCAGETIFFEADLSKKYLNHRDHTETTEISFVHSVLNSVSSVVKQKNINL